MNSPSLLRLTTTYPNRHVALSNTLSLLKYWCSLVATLTSPTTLPTSSLRSSALPNGPPKMCDRVARLSYSTAMRLARRITARETDCASWLAVLARFCCSRGSRTRLDHLRCMNEHLGDCLALGISSPSAVNCASSSSTSAASRARRRRSHRRRWNIGGPARRACRFGFVSSLGDLRRACVAPGPPVAFVLVVPLVIGVPQGSAFSPPMMPPPGQRRGQSELGGVLRSGCHSSAVTVEFQRLDGSIDRSDQLP